jgi:hypothetical protein
MAFLHPSARYSLLVRQRIRVALSAAAALAAISLSPGSAQAYVVTVGGVQYDVTTFTGTYNDNISKFATPANGGVMPWWGNFVIADNFAKTVAAALGSPNYSGAYGPIFANTYFAGITGPMGSPPSANGRIYRISTNSTLDAVVPLGDVVTYAQATALSTPVPAPLPLLGAALPLSFCRRLRSRSKSLRHGASRLS